MHKNRGLFALAMIVAPRHFSPTLKDWMPADPVAYVDGLNVYNAHPTIP